MSLYRSLCAVLCERLPKSLEFILMCSKLAGYIAVLLVLVVLVILLLRSSSCVLLLLLLQLLVIPSSFFRSARSWLAASMLDQ